MIYRLFSLAFRFMSHIPLPIGRFLGRLLGALFSLIPMSRKETVLINIQNCFGDSLGNYGVKGLSLRVFLHFGQMLFEIPHILKLNRWNLSRYVRFVHEENLMKALKKGKGVFLLSGHFGNWELMCAAISLRFGSMSVVARPFDFSPLDRLMNDLRSRFGADLIPKQKAMRRILNVLRQNNLLGILLDQNVDWYDGVFVNFLGRWACTNKGLALMAMKTGTPVIPSFSVRQKDGRYSIIFEDEIRLKNSGDKLRDVEDNTTLFAGVIEDYIRRYPDQWFWFHQRWKTQSYCKLPDDFYLQPMPGLARIKEERANDESYRPKAY